VLSFNEVSFIAPLANLLSVPLLGILLTLGTLICLSGLIAMPLALMCGWLAWPLLWYVTSVISWCSGLPGAYLQVNNLSPLVAWTYYAFLAWMAFLLITRWRPVKHEHLQRSPVLSQRAKVLIQCTLALIMVLSTSILAQAAPADKTLTLSLLSNGTPGQALFLRTRDGQTALIDEGASSATIAQTLDSRLPFWQRTLNLLILSDTSPTNLAGLQDVITRYQVQHVVDAGMLYPDLAYARWRNALDTRNLAYTQVRQGALITLGQQTTFQVLWPPAHLHKSSDETHDNALILRLQAPGLSLLFLDSTALSSYALRMFLAGVAPTNLQAQAVQLTGEEGKAFPPVLASVLAWAQPSLILLNTLPARRNKKTGQVTTPSLSVPPGPWQVIRGEQTGSLELQSAGNAWNINLSG
jgi:beta-lactamase superfamily II metal-dependent hydrolase